MTALFERKKLLSTCSRFLTSNAPYLAIHGFSGQGKTSLIKDFIHKNKVNAIWYTCPIQDCSESIFASEVTQQPLFDLTMKPQRKCEGLLSALHSHTDHLQHLKHTLESSNIDSTNLLFVIDDIHNIASNPLSHKVVHNILEILKHYGKVVIIGQETCNLFYRSIKHDTIEITSTDLNLTIEEVCDFFNTFLNKKITASQLASLFKATNGWVTGLLLLQDHLDSNQSLFKKDAEILNNYLQHLCLAKVSSKELNSLLILSHLDQIPICPHLAVEFALGFEILSKLEDKRLFVSQKDNKYVIHPLFRNMLKEYTKKQFSPKEHISNIKHLANILLQHDFFSEAMTLFIEHKEWNELTHLIEKNCDTLLYDNKPGSFGKALLKYPHKEIIKYPWILLAQGCCEIGDGKISSLNLLTQAYEQFEQRNLQEGALHASGFLCKLYCAISFNIAELSKYSLRGAELLLALHDTISYQHLTHSIYSISSGILYSSVDFSTYEKLIALLPKKSLPSEHCETYCSTIFLHAYFVLRGEIRAGMDKFSNSYFIQNSPNTTPVQSLTLKLVCMKLFLMEGNFNAFKRIQKKLHQTQLLSIHYDAADMLHVWKQNILLETNQLTAIINQNIDFTNNNHIVAQLLQYKMLAYAYQKNIHKTYEVEQKVLKLRAMVGGRYFLIYLHSFLAISRALMGDYKTAHRIVDIGLKRTTKHRLPMLTTSFHFARAIALEHCGKKKELNSTLFDMFNSLKQLDNKFFFGVTKQQFLKFSSIAVANDIHKQYVKKLAYEQFQTVITDNGAFFHTLKFNYFNALSVSNGGITLHDSALTPIQTQILKITLQYPHYTIPVETLIDAVWPDSPLATGRAKFDVTISRLRKVFSKFFGNGKEYLSVKNGNLTLTHSTDSLKVISKKLTVAMAALDKKQYWIADQTFWDIIEELPTMSPVSAKLSINLEKKLLSAIETWISHMQKAHLHNEVEYVLKKVLIICPYTDNLYVLLWKNLIISNKYAEAAQLKKQYRELLKESNIPNSVINRNEEVLFSMTSTPV